MYPFVFFLKETVLCIWHLCLIVYSLWYSFYVVINLIFLRFLWNSIIVFGENFLFHFRRVYFLKETILKEVIANKPPCSHETPPVIGFSWMWAHFWYERWRWKGSSRFKRCQSRLKENPMCGEGYKVSKMSQVMLSWELLTKHQQRLLKLILYIFFLKDMIIH